MKARRFWDFVLCLGLWVSDLVFVWASGLGAVGL